MFITVSEFDSWLGLSQVDLGQPELINLKNEDE
jgi:hypothetical protein